MRDVKRYTWIAEIREYVGGDGDECTAFAVVNADAYDREVKDRDAQIIGLAREVAALRKAGRAFMDGELRYDAFEDVIDAARREIES